MQFFSKKNTFLCAFVFTAGRSFPVSYQLFTFYFNSIIFIKLLNYFINSYVIVLGAVPCPIIPNETKLPFSMYEFQKKGVIT